MNVLNKSFFALCILMAVLAAAPLQAATPEDSFKKNFPDIPLETISSTDIPGVYEVVSGGKVGYYAPGPEYLIVGDIMTKEKRNLTQERVAELQARRFRNIPLAKALKIGKGPHTVIEITDPDCNYCRKASEYLKTRNDLTRHIFFFPLSIHPNAEAKIKYVFCAKDKAKAYEEAMTGKLDEMKFKPCDDAKVADLVKTHKEASEQAGVKELGTPFFLVNNQFVRGSNIPQIEKILGAKK